ncbi:MAG: protein-glutamate O-methyltransferase CheR [Candidatus Obscuribacterales bacterium]|nr:protein-glutamate O-methyltransferase CheR [Candidatus Obscuribacterales bacterium]
MSFESNMLENTEMLLLLEGICQTYGFDFKNYSLEILKYRIRSFARNEQLETISALQNKVLHDPLSMERLTDAITIHYTSMFLEPLFYQALRQKIIPMLKTYPSVRIWVPCCSTGQEAYSLAIMLEEEGIYDRCLIYATDFSRNALQKAKAGEILLDSIGEYTDNYLRSGGKRALSDYYSIKRDQPVFHDWLKKNIVFAQHNLVTDGSINEFNLVLARNVLHYFDNVLRLRFFDLAHNSLALFGILALDKKDLPKVNALESCYEEIDLGQKLFRRCV